MKFRAQKFFAFCQLDSRQATLKSRRTSHWDRYIYMFWAATMTSDDDILWWAIIICPMHGSSKTSAGDGSRDMSSMEKQILNKKIIKLKLIDEMKRELSLRKKTTTDDNEEWRHRVRWHGLRPLFWPSESLSRSTLPSVSARRSFFLLLLLVVYFSLFTSLDSFFRLAWLAMFFPLHYIYFSFFRVVTQPFISHVHCFGFGSFLVVVEKGTRSQAAS